MIVTPLEFFYARRQELLDQMTAQITDREEERRIRHKSDILKRGGVGPLREIDRRIRRANQLFLRKSAGGRAGAVAFIQAQIEGWT